MSAGAASITEAEARILMLGEDYDPVDGLRITLIKAGYRVHAARSEQESLPEVRLWNPDVILIDLTTLGPSGAAFCSELRELTTAQIIAFSEAGDPALLIDTLDAGADDFVWKPFSLQAVQARIRARLRRRPQQQ